MDDIEKARLLGFEKIYLEYGFDPKYFDVCYDAYINSDYTLDWFRKYRKNKNLRFQRPSTFRCFLEKYWEGF